MEGIVVTPTCAIDTLTSMVKSLQALYSTTWHDTFLGLWIAILRLVQREKNPCDGPVARLDSCLCMLLSITPLQLGEYEGLLTPPPSVASIANQAAITAIMYLSGLNINSGYLDSVSVSDVPINCGQVICYP
uniref:Uncharacterized protein n=1 Tax=Chenopodium quinoa TaxID=63459 RepID=A0A803MR13_CHEQI